MRFRLVEEDNHIIDIGQTPVKWGSVDVSDYTWDIEEPLEDILYYDDDFYENKYFNELNETWNKEPFEEGDIVMANIILNDTVNPHRMFLIDSIIDEFEGPIYKGYLLSSAIDKSNISEAYPKNILIKNYGSIVKENTGNRPNKDVIIKLDELYELNNDDFDDTGVKKGEATEKFKDFISIELDKIKHGESTADDYWNDGVPIIN